jgi:SAM-dependent methyltransferase
MTFGNSWGDRVRADSYARLEFPNTYYLAYRDLPDIIRTHVRGNRAVDFGCGTGRSTRFLKNLGFETIGADISPDMLDRARALDPGGDYRLVKDADYGTLGIGSHDLVLSVFTFDNIPAGHGRIAILRALASLLDRSGTLVCLASNPAMYTHEWASFTTREFPENEKARTGDRVRIVITDVDDRRPVEDVFFTEDDYRESFEQAGLAQKAVYRPLGRRDEPFGWVSETTIAPWLIFAVGIR